MLPSVSSLHVLKEISWRWSRRHLLSHHLRELGERRQGERSLGLEKLREFVAREVRSAWLREKCCGRGHLASWAALLRGASGQGQQILQVTFPVSLEPRDNLYFPVSYSLKEDVHLPSRGSQASHIPFDNMLHKLFTASLRGRGQESGEWERNYC